MEDHPPVFNYLGEEMMQQHLVDVTRSLQSCFEPGSDQYNKLARYTEKVVQKREIRFFNVGRTEQSRFILLRQLQSVIKPEFHR